MLACTGSDMLTGDIPLHLDVFRCTATNGHDQSDTKYVDVVVHSPPRIQVSEVYVHSYTGQDQVELLCSVHGHPASLVTWYRDLLPVGLDNVIKFNSGRKHSLNIQSVTSENFGNYTCKAENRFGKSEKNIELSGDKIINMMLIIVLFNFQFFCKPFWELKLNIIN